MHTSSVRTGQVRLLQFHFLKNSSSPAQLQFKGGLKQRPAHWENGWDRLVEREKWDTLHLQWQDHRSSQQGGKKSQIKSASGILLLQNTGYFSCWINAMFSGWMARVARAGHALLCRLKTRNEDQSCLMLYIPHSKLGYLGDYLIIDLNLRLVKNNDNSFDHIHTSKPSFLKLWTLKTEEMAPW